MSLNAEGRLSASPYVDSIWRGMADADLTLMYPADGRWNLCFRKVNDRVQVSVEGPLSQAVPQTHVAGVEWMVIKFRLGVFLPEVSASTCLDGSASLPNAAGQSFWLHGSAWQFPDFENADTFVNRLMRDEALQRNPFVSGALHGQLPTLVERTLRRHFQQTIGLTQSHIRQIERARDAMSLLQHDVPILDIVEQLHYADQPHLTRSMKRFMGYTPSQVIGWRLPM